MLVVWLAGWVGIAYWNELDVMAKNPANPTAKDLTLWPLFPYLVEKKGFISVRPQT